LCSSRSNAVRLVVNVPPCGYPGNNTGNQYFSIGCGCGKIPELL
jgi:hypothetical protein